MFLFSSESHEGVRKRKRQGEREGEERTEGGREREVGERETERKRKEGREGERKIYIEWHTNRAGRKEKEKNMEKNTNKGIERIVIF